jgi:hypothetical protein
MLRRVSLVGADVSKELIASIISVRKISELGTMLAVTSNPSTLWRALVYADNVNLLGDNIATTNKNTIPLIAASKEVVLKVHIDTTKYMLVSRHRMQVEIGTWNSKQFENMSPLKYLVSTVTNQNIFQEENKRRLCSGNDYHNSVQNLLYSRLLSINVKMNIYNTMLLQIVLYWF